MKKLYMMLGLAVMSMGSFAQSVSPLRPHKVDFTNAPRVNLSRGVNSPSVVDRNTYGMWWDYTVADLNTDGFVWQFNSLYTGTDTAMNYAAISYRMVGGYTDYANPTTTVVDYQTFGYTSAWPTSPALSLTFDSIFVYMTHENNSGNYDYLKCRLITTNAQGAPTTSSSVLWEQVDSFNTTQSSGGNWLGSGAGFVLTYTPGFTTTPGQRVALNIRYEDPSKLDTAALSATFTPDPNSADPNDPDALVSTFPTSFCAYPPFLPNILQNTSVTYTGGTPWPCQNWNMWAYITTQEAVGVNENGEGAFKLLHAYPNPASDMTNVRFELDKNTEVSFRVFDMSGREVFRNDMGMLTPGRHNVSMNTLGLADGVYQYTLTAAGSSVTRPVLVKH
ncbi:MAG: hypothetical protein RLZZ46_1089 [Bacteroidota bacterium]|jgi:hypothetical protein